MAVSCMRDASGHRNSTPFIADSVMWQILRSTERISRYSVIYSEYFILTTGLKKNRMVKISAANASGSVYKNWS